MGLRTLGILAAGAMVSFGAVSVDASVLYRESFPLLPGVERGHVLAAQGWYATQHGLTLGGSTAPFGSGATIFAATPDQISLFGSLGAINGGVNNLPIVVPPDTARGMMFASRAGGAWGFWTNEIVLPSAEIGVIRLGADNNSADTMHFAARVGGQWYVSQASVTASSGRVTELLEIDVRGSAYALADFRMEGPGPDADYLTTADNTPSFANLLSGFGTANGGVDGLPAGLVDGVGFFTPNLSGNQRYDFYEILVPEPGILSLLGVGSLMFLRRQRRA